MKLVSRLKWLNWATEMMGQEKNRTVHLWPEKKKQLMAHNKISSPQNSINGPGRFLAQPKKKTLEKNVKRDNDRSNSIIVSARRTRKKEEERISKLRGKQRLG